MWVMDSAKQIGRYRLAERLGKGGMGEVFLAEMQGAEGFSKKVAIKKLRAALAEDADAIRMLLEEAELAKSLHHGGIVQVYDLGYDQECPYIVVEYVEGASLREVIKAHEGTLPLGDIIFLVEQVASALHYAHSRTDEEDRPSPIVHRDVKPDNVLISRDGVVKLADFGIAKVLEGPERTMTGVVKGTIGYLSPEQAGGESVDARTDQFALGIMLYELLDGKNPMGNTSNLISYVERLSRGLPPLPLKGKLDEEIQGIVARATATEPGDRYASLEEMRSALEEWRVHQKVPRGEGGLRKAVRELRAAKTAETLPSKPRRAIEVLDQLPPQATAPTVAAGVPRAAANGAKENRPLWLYLLPLLLVAGIGMALFLAPSDDEPVSDKGIASEASESEVPTAVPPVEEPLPANLADAQTPSPADAGTPTELVAMDEIADAAPPKKRKPSPRAAAKKAPGQLWINVLPYADVEIDGKKAGPTPLRISLSPGMHRIRLSRKDRPSQTRKIKIVSGKVNKITSW
jgi:tRNA A-37 threonylcarbamoyl transferase component Bud32